MYTQFLTIPLSGGFPLLDVNKNKIKKRHARKYLLFYVLHDCSHASAFRGYVPIRNVRLTNPTLTLVC